MAIPRQTTKKYRVGAVRKGKLTKTKGKEKTIRQLHPEIGKRVSTLCAHIAHQFPATAEGKLMAAVVTLAIDDLIGQSKECRAQAIAYLTQKEIYHAEVADVDTDWIQMMLVKSGIMEFARNLMASEISSRFRGIAA